VFKRFYRSDASRSVEGYGLGLSLVDAIAKLHGFRVTIDDNKPGSVFSVFSPLP
jgi:signal transduction histidine kinase